MKPCDATPHVLFELLITTTFTRFGELAGVVASIVPESTTRMFDAGSPPKKTCPSCRKLVPVIVTFVPPSTRPAAGEIEMSLGGASVITIPPLIIEADPPRFTPIFFGPSGVDSGIDKDIAALVEPTEDVRPP